MTEFDWRTLSDSPYEDMRRLIVLVRLSGEEDARTCAAMLSLIDKAESSGDPAPGYVEVRDRARALGENVP